MKQHVVWLIGLATALFLCDFFSKQYARDHIPPMLHFASAYPYGGVAVFYDFLGINFSLNYAVNRGAAWGLFSSFPHALLIFRMIVVIGMFGYLILKRHTWLHKLGLTVVLVGAIGNVVDYFVYGHVVDLFHFVFWGYSFPIFNVADSAIFCGISLLLLSSFFSGSKMRAAPHQVKP